MKTIIFLTLTLFFLTQAYQSGKQPTFLQKQTQEPDCCAPEDVDECEVALLENYRTIDIDRHIEIREQTSIAFVYFDITLDHFEDITAYCTGEEFKSTLSYFDHDHTLVPIDASYNGGILQDIHTSYASYSFNARLVDIEGIRHEAQGEEGQETDVVKFQVEIQKQNTEVIRKHTFRVYIHVNDQIVDTVKAKGKIPKTKIFESNEDCADNNYDRDGECRVVIDYKTEMDLFTDPAFSIYFSASTEFTIGDYVYGIISFKDPSVSKYLEIVKFLFRPFCCDDPSSYGTELFGTPGLDIVNIEISATYFRFITFKEVDYAGITVHTRIRSLTWDYATHLTV